MALSRIIRIGDIHGFEFRAEAYNLTNSFRPGALASGQANPVAGLNSPTFGQIRTALDPRILRFALKYFF